MHESPISLRGAIPYIRLYKGKTFVVKAGGRILEKPQTLDALAEDVALLHQLGVRVVLVHGGGPQATDLSRRLGTEPRFVAGRRVTDETALDAAKMTFGGAINIDVLTALRAHHTPAVGVSGVDGGLLTARRRPVVKVSPNPGDEPVDVDFGFVGDVTTVDGKVLEHLLAGDLVPVVASLAADERGGVLNVNADTVAEVLAVALKAEKLLLLTDVGGLLRDPESPTSLVSFTDLEGIEAMKRDGRISGGMLPKVAACARALKGGVRRTHILNGMRPGALLVEAFTNAGCGTMIVEKLDPQGTPAEEIPA